MHIYTYTYIFLDIYVYISGNIYIIYYIFLDRINKTQDLHIVYLREDFFLKSLFLLQFSPL